jgi:hypothetical protein
MICSGCRLGEVGGADRRPDGAVRKYAEHDSQVTCRGVNTVMESATYRAIFQEAMARGMLLGAKQEARKIVRLQATKRFGPPGRRVLAALDRIDELETLEELTLRLLDVFSWAELLALPPSPTRRRLGGRRTSSSCLPSRTRRQCGSRRPPRPWRSPGREAPGASS